MLPLKSLRGGSTRRFAGRLATRHGILANRSWALAGELGRIALGRSEIAPSRRDRRFTDPAWTSSPALRRIVQCYLAASQSAESIVTDAALDWRDEARVRFVVDNIVAALAPSNNPLLNPEAWKSLIDTGGMSAVTGLRNLVDDLATAPRVPTMVEPDTFHVGKDLGITPGQVVLRTEVFELIRYGAQTDQVRTVPLLVVPPVINKFYIADLAPGRSMVEHFVRSGHQVFVMSWRNPDARHRDWGLDTYATAILEALGATRSLADADRAHLTGVCSGGILAAMTVAHLAAIDRLDEVATLGLAVAVLDNERAGIASALVDELSATASVTASRRRGFLDGKALAEVFAWLRPNDLVWNYWTNNYLNGRKPAPFDVLFWNADTTRVSAALHHDFVELATTNALVEPKTATVLGTQVDLSAVTVPAYVVAGLTDHISPWEACYRSTQLLGGTSRFVLSTSGHVQAMVNPPDNPKASYRVNDAMPQDAESWAANAATVTGSWWPDYTDWLAERGGALRSAPEQRAELGSAPGTYVLAR